MTDRKISLGGFAAGLTAGVAALAFASSVSVAQTKELRMIEAGGPSGESIQVGYLDPYKKKSGINVVRENPSSLGKLQAMIKSGAITADMLELDSGGRGAGLEQHQPGPDLRRSQGQVRLWLPVLFNHHGLG
jgi:spermidine/putrescine-binding protein